MAQGRNLQNLAPRPTQIDETRHTGESVILRFVSGGTTGGTNSGFLFRGCFSMVAGNLLVAAILLMAPMKSSSR